MADERTAREAQAKFHDELMKSQDVVGTGIRDIGNGELGLAVYVKSDAPKEVREALPSEVSIKIAGKTEAVKIQVVETGGGFKREALE